MKTKNFNVVRGVNACSERLPAASTFKVPLAVMAFDTKVLQDAKTGFKWDGTERPIEAWNKDHNAETWMRDSVVWFSQIITPIIKQRKMKMYLDSFKYGNADLSSGILYSWLTTAEVKNSLKISAYEQVIFLDKLWRGELKASKKAQMLTRSIIPIDISDKGYRLSGKTGSGLVNDERNIRVGWFVGHYKNNKSEFIVVTNFVDKQKQDTIAYGGPEAKQMTIQFLKEMNLW